MTEHYKRSQLWSEIKQYRAWYVLSAVVAFFLWSFPVGFLQSWPSLIRDTSFPEWLVQRGWPSLTVLVILWLTGAAVLTLTVALIIILRAFRTAEHKASSALPESPENPTQPHAPELRGQYELREIQPNLVFSQYSVVGAHEEDGHIIEGNNERDLTFHAVVAEFNNRVDSEATTAAIDQVSATLTYTFFDKRSPIGITRGIWLSHGPKVGFGINDTHRLIIATLEGNLEGRNVYALDGSYSVTDPRRHLLSEPLVKVNVTLVAESQSKVINRFEFMVEVTRDSEFLADMKVLELTRWKHGQLLDLLVRGTNFLNQYNERKNLASYGGLAALGEEEALETIEREANVWATVASKFLATHFSEQHQFRFIAAVSGTHKDFKDLPQGLTGGVQVLYETIEEVGGLHQGGDDLSRLVKTFGPFL